MADKRLGLDFGGRRAKAIKRAFAHILPEWQVFIRRPDGCADHFKFTVKRQLALMGGIAALTFWAGMAALALNHQPEELAAKERQLEELMASTRAAQHRLDSAQKLVGDVTREIDAVHANLTMLNESQASLSKGKPAAAAPGKVKLAAEPSYDDAAQPGGPEAKAVREQVRRLEASLEKLKAAYAEAVRNTASLAGQRVGEAEKQISKLGLDPDRLTAPGPGKHPGQGGPFIPARADGGSGELLGNLEKWQAIQGAMQRLPLEVPLRDAYEFNSGFGTRNDPLNNKTGIHEGIDLGGPVGTPVYATGDGVVKLAEPWDRYGNTVDIDHGNGVTTRYAHLQRIKVKVGQRVSRATVIGTLGNSGRSTGPHLHYEVRVADHPRDPLKFISVGRDAPKAR